MDMMEESPNGYSLVADAPERIDEAIEYYSQQLRTYTVDFPEEFGICHFKLAQLFAKSIPPEDVSDDASVKIENAVFHAKKALDIFTQDSHPIMWAVVGISLGQFFRRRVEMMSDRSFLAGRAGVRDTIRDGLDALNGTLIIFQQAKPYCVEHAICNQELGFLYLKDLEYCLDQDLKQNKDATTPVNKEVEPGHIRQVKELSISHLERALSITEGLPSAKPGFKPRTWDALDQSTHPPHIKTLLNGHTISYFEGVCIYLIGRSYFDCNAMSTIEAYEQELKRRKFTRDLLARQLHADDDDSDAEPDDEEDALVAQMMEESAPRKGDIYDPEEEVLDENGLLDRETFLTPKSDIQQCYKYLIKSLSNRYLVRDSAYWTDAHDKVATVVLNNPRLVNLDYQKPGVADNDIHVVSVVSHLQAAVKSPHADYSEMQMDLHFRCAQCNIYRVYLVTDRVPPGESISQAFAKSFDATSILLAVEKHMLFARQFVTAANNQSTKDAYAFFYSCLKLAEYKMLYSGIIEDVPIAQRELIFQQSVYYILEALLARPLFDNQDLHYCTLVQLCQMLMAARKKHIAVLAYGRLLITLSTVVNRSVYSPVNESKKLLDEIYRQSGNLLYAANSTVEWEQTHAGPTTKPTTGGPPPVHEAPITNLTSHNAMHTAKSMHKPGSMASMTGANSFSAVGRYNHDEASLHYNYKEQVLQSIPGGRDGKAVWSFEAKSLDYVAVQHSAAIRLQRFQKWKEYEDGVRHALVLKRKEQKVSAFMDRQDQIARQQLREENPDDSSSSEDENNFKVKKRPVAPMVPKLPDLPGVEVEEREIAPPQGVPLKLHKAIVAHTVDTYGGDPNFSSNNSVAGGGTLMLGNGESPAAHLMIGDASHQAGAGARYGHKKPVPPPGYDNYQDLTSSDDETIDDITTMNIEKHLASNPQAINSKNAQDALEPTYYKTELGGIIAAAASDRGPYIFRKRRLLKISDDTGDVFPSPEYTIAKEAVKKLMEEPRDTGVDKSVFKDLSNNMHNHAHHDPPKLQKQKVDVNMMTAYQINKKQENLFRGGNHTDSDEDSDDDSDESSNSDGEEGENDSFDDLSDEDSDEEDESDDSRKKKRRRKKPNAKANAPGFVSKFFGMFRRDHGKVAADKYASPKPKKLSFKKKKEPWVPFEQKVVGQAVAGIKGIVKLKDFVTGKITETVVGKKPPRILGQIWGSKNAYLYFSVMSRVQRLHLILRTDRLRTQEGARARAILAEAISVADKNLSREYKILQRKMQIICRNLVLPPATLRELSHRSLADLKALFSSQTAMARMLFQYEVMLFKNLKGSLAMKFANPKAKEGISKYDYFIPIVSNCQTLTKNILKVGQVCDIAVENISVFDPNQGDLDEDEAVGQDDHKFKKNSQAAGKYRRETSGKITVESDESEDSDEVPMVPKMFVDTAAWKPGQAPTMKKSGKDTRIVGKVTVEFCQALDGTLDGTRAFFNHHLKSDECIISWHLPVMPNQPLQCVIAWRDSIPHDEKERKNWNKFGKSAAPMPTTREKQRATSRSFSSWSSTSAFAAAEREKIAEERRQEVENAAHGIVSGVIIEAAQSEVDSMQVHYHIQQWLDALHARPAPRRVSMCTEALRNLSDCLSVGELLLMVPSHVSALIVCGPPVIRLVPWHLLFIEIERDFVLTDEEIQAREDGIVEERRKQLEEKRFLEEQKLAKLRNKAGPVNEDEDEDEQVMTMEEAVAPRPAPLEEEQPESEAATRKKVRDDGQERPPVLLEVPLCERFSVRMGPSLPLMEITSAAMKNIRHVHGNHHMCCINGSPIVKFGSKAVNDDKGTSEEGHLGHTMDDDAVKFATLELETVSTTWSADPDDSYTVFGIASAPEAWRTTPLNRADIIDHIGEYVPDQKTLKRRALRKLAHKRAKEAREARNSAMFTKLSVVEIPGGYDAVTGKKGKKKAKKGKDKEEEEPVPLPDEISSSDESDEDYEFTNNPFRSYINACSHSLDLCRVLHVCAAQIPREKIDTSMLSQEELDKKKSEPIPIAELSLPASKSKVFERKRRNQPDGVNSANIHSGLSSKDIVQQMYLRNCALAVMSRFGPTDDVWDVKDSESNFELIESFHLAGACCVMYPLWGGLTCGSLGVLANNLMMVKFYADLSTYANSRQPIADASRGAQLWLRDATAREIIAYLNNSPMLEKTRLELIEQLQAYLNPVPIKKSFGQVNPTISATDLGDRKLFNHFLFWGSFVVSGTTGAVHIPELVQADITDAQVAAELNDDGALDIEFERDILKLEGKTEDAQILTKQILQNRVDAVKNSMFNIKKATAPIRKAFDDKIKEFDKLFLDQDSDSIEISESDRLVWLVGWLVGWVGDWVVGLCTYEYAP